MSLDLLGLVKGYFNNDLIDKAASFLGEDKATVSKGIDSIIPASLLGIIGKAEGGNASSLLNLASTAADSGILSDIAGTFMKGGGGIPSFAPSLITGLFGDKFGGLANTVSGFTGLKGSTVSSLFGTVVPVALAALGKYAKDNNSTPGAISSLLGGMKSSVLGALPSGLNVSQFFSGSSATPSPAPVEEKKSFNPWWLILALVGAGLIFWLAKGCGKGDKPAEAATVIHDTLTKVDSVVVMREPAKVKLPNGVELDAYKGGIEDLLVAFIQDAEAQPGKDNWFDFNDLNFKFGTSEINADSRREVDNLVQILKAFPKTKIKIGGYTDNIGDEAANKKLSLERAQAVQKLLADAGVNAQIEGAEGYGSEFAKYPPSAPEMDRVKDRRVSVSVRAK
ncbi:MAG: OmpA family protein [Sphingobacteriales bacterium]|jgi:outer membrane protein OmpA-like peptidoglycan-associated protein